MTYLLLTHEMGSVIRHERLVDAELRQNVAYELNYINFLDLGQ